MLKSIHRNAQRLNRNHGNPLSRNDQESSLEGKSFAETIPMEVAMETPGMPEKAKRKMKKGCPVCGKRLYQDAHERWYCARCQAEVDGERVSFNYIPEDELNTQLQTG
jgi:hypothetical protein